MYITFKSLNLKPWRHSQISIFQQMNEVQPHLGLQTLADQHQQADQNTTSNLKLTIKNVPGRQKKTTPQ